MNPSAPTAEPGDTQSAEVSTERATSGRVGVDDDRILGGVAGFIARRLGVDALWVRIGFVLLALAGGIGLVLYAGLWLVWSADRSTSWRWPRIIGGAIVVVGIPLLLNAQAGRFVTGPVAVVLLLTGLALALWRPPSAPGGTSEAAAAIDDRPPSSLARPMPSPTFSQPPPGSDADRSDWRRPRLPRRESSVLGRATLGLAIAVAAVGALVDEANDGRLHPEQWLGAAAVVCGLGLLVGTVRGHGRWLIVPGVLFAGAGYATGISTRLGIDASDTFGERRVWIGPQQSGGPRTAHSAFGSVDVNVDGVPDEQVVVDARVGIGDISIWVNDQVAVEVRSRVDDGDLELNGARLGDDEPVRLGPEGPPDVIVEAWIGRGDVNIDTYMFDVLPTVKVVEPALPGPQARPALPAPDAPLAVVSDAVAATADGWFVLGDGSAVIGPDDVVVVGEQFRHDDGVSVISTPYGEFQLLPRSLLITPFDQVLDLQAIRAELAAATPSTTVAADTVDTADTADSTTTVAPPQTTVPAVPPGSVGG
ncbi:MAG TPA: PspC domain-containing protein [Ilumatobacteraceae bacterium]|nr:PspC domain-containing protein [Ilumatobacteraceae bacterium]